MALAAWAVAMLLAADPEGPPAAPPPPAALQPAPHWTPSPILLRVGLALGATTEMGKDDGNLTVASAAVLFRAGPLYLGPELAGHWFPGAPASDGMGTRGLSGSLLLGSGLALSPRLRLVGLAEAGFQTYWLSRDTFVGTRSGGDGQLTFAGARLGLDYVLRERATLSVLATFRHTLASSTETYTETTCAFGCTSRQGEVRYGGLTVGLEVAVSVGVGGGD